MLVTPRVHKLLAILFLLGTCAGLAHALWVIGSRLPGAFKYKSPKRSHSTSSSHSKLPIKPNPGFSAGECEYWRNTAGCDPAGNFEFDRSCKDSIPGGASGYCQCRNFTAAHSNCNHKHFRCMDICAQAGAGGMCRASIVSRPGDCRPRPKAKPGKKLKPKRIDCVTSIQPEVQAYCECTNGQRVPSVGNIACGHLPFSCGVLCEAKNKTQALSLLHPVKSTRRRRWRL